MSSFDFLEPVDIVIRPPQRIASVEGSRRWWRVRECDLQWAFEAWLRETHPTFEVQREVLIEPGNRPDLLAVDRLPTRVVGIVFELKWIAGQDAVRQISRYVEAAARRYSFDEVFGVLVAESFYLREQPEWLSLLPVETTVDWTGVA